MLLSVRLQPRAKRNEIVGEREGVIFVRVAAAPVDGKANEALRKLLAKRLRLPRGAVEIVRGERSRNKTIRITGMSENEVRTALVG